ncbi:PIN domain-containing protein [Nitrospira sp. M1]
MTPVLFDTNILLDVFLQRKSHVSASRQAIDLVGKNLVQGYVSGHAVTTLSYLLTKHLDAKKSKAILTTLLTRFTVAAVTDTAIRRALESPIKDFEDAVAHAAAEESEIAIIATRNIRDFAKGSIPAILPEMLVLRFSVEQNE